MNRITSWLQSVNKRVTITLFVIALMLFIDTAFSFSNGMQAKAESLVPKSTQNQVNDLDSSFRENDQEKVNQLFKENKNPQTAPETTQKLGEILTKPAKLTKQKLKSTTDAVGENLNDFQHKAERKSLSFIP